MTGISIEQVGKDLWFRGDDGTLVTAAVCLVLGRDDRNNMLIIPEKRHLGMVLAQIDIIEACRHKPPQVYGLLAFTSSSIFADEMLPESRIRRKPLRNSSEVE